MLQGDITDLGRALNQVSTLASRLWPNTLQYLPDLTKESRKYRTPGQVVQLDHNEKEAAILAIKAVLGLLAHAVTESLKVEEAQQEAKHAVLNQQSKKPFMANKSYITKEQMIDHSLEQEEEHATFNLKELSAIHEEEMSQLEALVRDTNSKNIQLEQNVRIVNEEKKVLEQDNKKLLEELNQVKEALALR